jgi:retron-type reverse transcriptase
MVRILSEKIHDNRFLRLIRQMLQAGYLEDWTYHETLSGAPQGGVVSPILSNIYLHQLDVFVETVLIPQYTRGNRRKANPEYARRHVQTLILQADLDGVLDCPVDL